MFYLNLKENVGSALRSIYRGNGTCDSHLGRCDLPLPWGTFLSGKKHLTLVSFASKVGIDSTFPTTTGGRLRDVRGTISECHENLVGASGRCLDDVEGEDVMSQTSQVKRQGQTAGTNVMGESSETERQK